MLACVLTIVGNLPIDCASRNPEVRLRALSVTITGFCAAICVPIAGLHWAHSALGLTVHGANSAWG